MGNDGGSIPRRNEMVREKKKDEQTDRQSQLAAMSSLCTLSNEPLREPVVGDGLGRLYNRETILEYLLGKGAHGDAACAHIEGLKDVVTLTLKPNPAGVGGTAGRTPRDKPAAPFVCPITLKEMNGSLPFEFPWTCGCVFSAQARRELAGSDACPVCSKPYDPRDIVPINALSPEIVASLHARMAERVAEREKRRADKKKLKGKPKRKRGDGGDVPSEPTPETSLGDKRTKVPKARA